MDINFHDLFQLIFHLYINSNKSLYLNWSKIVDGADQKWTVIGGGHGNRKTGVRNIAL